jgi:hypothetical protein
MMPSFDNILVDKTIGIKILQDIAANGYGDMIKAVVDIEKSIMVLGSEMHVDAEALMIEKLDCEQKNLWGINIYPELSKEDRLEFDSMINIRPYQNNSSRDVLNPELRQIIRRIVDSLIQ